MSSSAVFMGGPLDGQLRAYPDDEPPRSIAVAVPPTMAQVANLRPAEAIPFTNFKYGRQVSSLDDGPLWVYVPLGGTDD